MADLNVNIGDLKMKNPVMTASGTFGYGEEFSDFIDIARIGGIIVKGTTLHKREGNPYPRMAETPSGMLNAVGLQNKGVEYFVEHIYPRIKDIETNMIVNVSGSTIEDYVKTAEIINELDKIPAIELNISCPNVKQGGIAFGVDPAVAARVTTAVKEKSRMPVIVKLTPNVTDIASIARAIEDAGADAISLINTVLGGAIDVWHRRPRIANVFAGLSGPAIRPIAIRCVMQVANAVNIPIIGMGGNENGYTAAEFMMAGATATAFGTSGFANRTISPQAIEQLREVAYFHGFSSTNALVKSIRSQS